MNLHIFDNQIKLQNDNSLSIGWNSNDINVLLEKNKKKLRSIYVNAIYEIINNKTNKINHFTFKGMNLMEMSLINEKNPFKSSCIFDCLKLLVIEDIVKQKKIKKIFYYGKNYNVHKSLKLLCINSKLSYLNKNFIFNKFKFKSIYFFKGLLFFLIQILKNFKLTNNFKRYSQITFFSYFVHFKSTKSRKFDSNLWGGVPKQLNYKKKIVNWFHFYVPSNQIQNASKANKLKKSLNLNKYENHNFINSYLSIENYTLSLLNYLKLCLKNLLILENNRNFFKNRYSKSNFFYFLQEDFLSSLFGSTLIYNLMNIQALDKLLKNIPKQKIGIYIIENQSWEYALIKFWRKYNHGKIIAYFNSSIRFWDLRYLKKKNEFKLHERNPDQYLVNSKIFKNEAKKIGFPKKKLHLVEALRYSKLKHTTKIKKNKKILILGDILLEETLSLLELTNKIVPKLKGYKFYFKPHPTMTSKSINMLKSKYHYLKIVYISSEKFNNFEFVVCSNGTSAVLDCLALRLNFCSVKPLNSLNLYPIEKYQKLFEARSAEDLIKRIKKPNRQNSVKIFEKSKNFSKFLNTINKI